MLYRVIEDENHNLVTEALAGTPLVAFDDTLDDTSENAVQNKVITEALDTKLTKPDGVLVCWPNNTLLKWDETSEELAPIATPTADGQTLIASLTPQTVTVYSTGGGTFYDVNFQTVSEPSGTAGIPTQVGDFFEYNGTWYKKDGADYYEVTSFTDAGTLVTDAALIADLDTKVFFTYSSVVYAQATSDVSYAWDTIGLGCKWTSSDTYACIETCDACSLAHLDGNGVSLGYGNIYAKVCCDCIDIKGCTAVVNVGTDSVVIGVNATTAAVCSTAIGYCASANCCCGTAIGASASTDSGVSIGRNAHSDASGTAIGRNSYACSMGVSVGCYAGTYKCGEGATIIGDNAGGTCYGIAVGNLSRSCDYGVAIGYSTYAYGACKSIAIGYGSATLSSNTIVIGNDITADNTCCEGDTLIGSCSNVFKFCGATGYTYGNGCMMTGRILNDATELPATNCSLLLYYVP